MSRNQDLLDYMEKKSREQEAAADRYWQEYWDDLRRNAWSQRSFSMINGGSEQYFICGYCAAMFATPSKRHRRDCQPEVDSNIEKGEA